MPWKGKNVLVTGARGFIGGYLVDALTMAGASVTALASAEAPPAGDRKILWLHGDITDPASLRGACEGIDVVFHLAAISSVVKAIREPGLTLRTNTVGTMNVLEEARASGVKKVIYVSSAHVYGAPEYLPVDERHRVFPREPYAASKIAAEAIVEAYGNAYGMGNAVIRPFNVFGAGQDESFLIPGIISQAIKNKIIKVGNTEPTRDFLYVEDCVQGFLAIGDKGTGIYNIGSGREVRIADAVEKVRDLISADIPVVSDDDRKRAAKVEIPRMCADVSRLKGLGWSPKIGFEEGLARTIKKEMERPRS